MAKFMGLKGATKETGMTEYTLRGLCKQGKIRFILAGNTKYILRMDWLEEDLEKMALENMKPADKNIQVGKLRKIDV